MTTYHKKEHVYHKGITRLSPAVKAHVVHMLHIYHDLKRLTKIQHGDYAEATDRYNWSMKWYEIMRETLEEWRSECPVNAAIIEEQYAIGNIKNPWSAVKSSMVHNYGSSTIYHLRDEFAYEIGMKAIKAKLILTDE